MGGRWGILALVLAASGMATNTSCSSNNDANVTVSPPLADSATRNATMAFLAGDGGPLMTLLTVAKSLSSETDCEPALTELSSGPPPDQLASIAAETPDAVLGSGFITLITSTDEHLTRCIESGVVDAESADQLREAIDFVDQRISDLQ